MYTSFVRPVLVIVVISKIALAQPSTTPALDPQFAAFEACKDRRHAMTVDAMKVANIQERGRRLAATVECQRPTIEVTNPTAPPDLVVDGLVTEADLIVGGSLHAKNFVWGNYNDGTLVVAGDVVTPLLVMTDHTFECGGAEKIKRKLEDPESDDLAKLFIAAVLDDGGLDRDRMIKALKKTTSVLKPAKKR